MEFAPFRPDQGELISGTPTNVFMAANGYTPRPTLSAAPGAAVFASAGQVRGAVGVQVPGSNYNAFLASATKVYKMTATYGYTDLGVTFAIPSGEDESLAPFQSYMLMSNESDGFYAYNMVTPAGLNAVSGAPAARYVFGTNNLVVALGSTSSNRARLANSAFGDHTNWTTKGASKQDMPDGGDFTGGSDLGNGAAILLQQTAVRLMMFGNVGGGAVFALKLLAKDVGCVHPRAQVTANGVCYFVDPKGIFACDGSGPPVNIGADKVNKWFLANCPDLTKVYLSADPANTIVRIRYRSASCNSDVTFTDLLDYNYITREFIPHTESTNWLFRMATPGYTLDSISSAYGALDNWSQYPLDSAFWQGGNNPRSAGITSAGKFGFFDGPSAAATLETNTISDSTSNLINWCEPLTDDSAVTVRLGVKARVSDDIEWKDAASLKSSGRVPVRGRGRFQRYRAVHAAGATWTHDLGINPLDNRQAARR
jgi:hypothetical protein